MHIILIADILAIIVTTLLTIILTKLFSQLGLITLARSFRVCMIASLVLLGVSGIIILTQ